MVFIYTKKKISIPEMILHTCHDEIFLLRFLWFLSDDENNEGKKILWIAWIECLNLIVISKNHKIIVTLFEQRFSDID